MLLILYGLGNAWLLAVAVMPVAGFVGSQRQKLPLVVAVSLMSAHLAYHPSTWCISCWP